MLPVLPLFYTLARSPLLAPSHTCALTPPRLNGVRALLFLRMRAISRCCRGERSSRGLRLCACVWRWRARANDAGGGGGGGRRTLQNDAERAESVRLQRDDSAVELLQLQNDSDARGERVEQL